MVGAQGVEYFLQKRIHSPEVRTLNEGDCITSVLERDVDATLQDIQ
jgi:hypothetical protein